MARKVIYWVVTGLVALSAAFAGVIYLWGSQQGGPVGQSLKLRSTVS